MAGSGLRVGGPDSVRELELSRGPWRLLRTLQPEGARGVREEDEPEKAGPIDGISDWCVSGDIETCNDGRVVSARHHV